MYFRFTLSILGAVIFSLASMQVAAEGMDTDTSFTIVTWNIQVGTGDDGEGNGWKKRKSAMVHEIAEANPDLLCMQEARLIQLLLIEKSLPKHQRVGVARDDGKEAGEFCPILFRKDKFELLKSGTFWLSDTPDEPLSTWDSPPYKRICTHALLKSLEPGKIFAVMCTHFPSTEEAREKAAELLMKRMNALYQGIPILYVATSTQLLRANPGK